MVRTAFYFCIGLFSVSILSSVVFAQNLDRLVTRLGLKTTTKSGLCQTSSPSALAYSSSTHQYSKCEKFFGSSKTRQFRFSEEQKPLSLQHIRDVSSLAHQGGRSRLFQTTKMVPLLSNAFSAGIEMAYRDPFLNINATPSSTSELGTHLVLRGSMKKMRYRAEYGYAGQKANKGLSKVPHDRVGGAFLWEWQLPFITPKVELSRFTNTAENNLTRYQTISTRQEYSLDWTMSHWPSFTLSYGREKKDILNQEEGSRSHARTIERVRAKIDFERTVGKGEWSLGYSTYKNDIHDQGTLEKFHSTLKGAVQLFEPIDFTPSMGITKQTNDKQNFSQERLFANLGTTVHLSTHQTIQPSFELVRINNRGSVSTSSTLSSKLQYSYSPDKYGYHISAAGQYILNKTSQQLSNPQTYDISIFVKKDLHDSLNLPHQQQFISLKLTHNQQINALSPKKQPNSSAAMLLLSFIP